MMAASILSDCFSQCCPGPNHDHCPGPNPAQGQVQSCIDAVIKIRSYCKKSGPLLHRAISTLKPACTVSENISSSHPMLYYFKFTDPNPCQVLGGEHRLFVPFSEECFNALI